MYRLIPIQYSLGTLLLGPLAFLTGGILLALAIWLSATSPPGEEGAQFLLAVLCYVGALASLVTSFVGFYFLYDAYRNGREIIFVEDHLVIHYPWPKQTQTYDWDRDIREIAVKYEQLTGSTVAWAPLPLAALVPGSEVLMSISLREQQPQNVRYFHVLHKDGRLITEIPSTTQSTFKITRWFNRKTLCLVMRVFNGVITWKGDQPRLVTMRDFPFEEGMFALVHEWLRDMPGLEELDLTGSEVCDEDLKEFASERYPNLKKVHAQGTRVTPKFLAALNAHLGKRGAGSSFNFG